MAEKQKKSGSKLGTLAVLYVLKNYSSESRRLSQQEIIDYMKRDYELELDRKTVGRTIKLLEEFGNLNGVEFSIDISRKKGACIRKNESIDRMELERAIRQGKKVEFIQYVYDYSGHAVPNDKEDHKKGKFEVDPYAVVRNMGNEYLVCHKTGDDNTLRNLRLSRISNILVLEDKERMSINKIEGFEKEGIFNKVKYEKSFQYHMFSGKPVLVEFLLNEASDEDKRRNFNTLYSELSGFEYLNSRELPTGQVKISCYMPKTGAKIFAVQFAELCTLVWPADVRQELTELMERIGENYKAQKGYGEKAE